MRLFLVDFCRFPGNSCGSCGCGSKHKKNKWFSMFNGNRVITAFIDGQIIIPQN